MRQCLKKFFTTLLTFALVISGSGVLVVSPALATITSSVITDYTLTGGAKVRPGQSIVPVVFKMTDDAGAGFSTIKMTIAQTAGTIVAGDFNSDVNVVGGASMLLVLDNNNNDQVDNVGGVGGDVLVTSFIGTSFINIGGITEITPDSDPNTPNAQTPPLPASANGNWNYALVFLMSATAAAGDSFTVSFASGTDTLRTNVQAINVPQTVTTQAISVDTTAPTAVADGQVGAGGPANNQTNVPVEAFVDRKFSEALRSSSLTTSTVLLQTNTNNEQAGAPTGSNLCVNVFFNTASTSVVCEHMSDATPLSASTWYTFTITTGITDVAGNALASNYSSKFQTGSFVGGAAFNPPPFLEGTMPARGGTLAGNGNILLKFSRVMNSTTGDGKVIDKNNIQLFALDTKQAVTGSNLFTATTNWAWNASRKELKIVPPTLTNGTRYRLIVKADNDNNPGNGSCGTPGDPLVEPSCVMSSDNLALTGSDYFLEFSAAANDSTPPTVLGSSPQNAGTGVDRSLYDISVSFNESLDPSTVTTTNIRLITDDNANNVANPGAGDTVLSNVSVLPDPDGRGVHLSPSGLLAASTKHFVLISSGANGVKDVVGNALSADLSLSFTTGANVNGGGSDSISPKVDSANADNQGLFLTFNEPIKFDATANANKASSSTANMVNNVSYWTIETSADAGTTYQPVILTDQSGALLSGKTVEYQPDIRTLKFGGLSLPPTTLFRITGTTSVQDLSNNALDSNNRIATGTVKNAQQTGGALGTGTGGGNQGGPNFFTMGEKPVMFFPQKTKVGATSSYRIEFPVTTAIPASGTIKFTLPSGFSFDTTNATTTLRCTSFPTDTFENSDINGPATGVVAVASVSCDTVSRVLTVTLGSVAVNANDILRFKVQGVVNSTVPKDFSTSGYTVDIKTYNTSSTLLETMTTMPFFLGSTGARSVSGKIFVDDGAGGGTASDEIPNGSEAGVQSVKVCMGGPAGFDCVSTDSSGVFTFSDLNNGFYHIDVPPLTTGTITGGPFFRDVNINGANITNMYFPVREMSTGNLLDVSVTASGLNGTKVDIFAFQTKGIGLSQASSMSFVVREATISNNAATVQLPLSTGVWEVGLGPWMPKEPGSPVMPDFTFIPPKSQLIKVDGSGVPDLCGGAGAPEVCFNLAGATHQIKGKIVDGSGAGIANAFIMARPSFVEASSGPGGAVPAQSDTKGNFNLKVKGGTTYLIEAFMPGMPQARSNECTVKDTTIAIDNNTTADVSCSGILIVNDIAGFTDASVNVTNITSNDLVIAIKKGGYSISGRVLDDSSNAIPFAHVQAQQVDSSGNPSGGWADAPTDNSGNYTIYVNDGTWRIKAFAPGFGELPSLTVTMASQNLSDKNLQVLTGGFYTVSGQVLKGVTGVQGAFVHSFGPCGGNGTVSDDSGNYTLKLRATGSCTTDANDNEGYTIEGFVPGEGPAGQLTGIAVTQNLTAQNLTQQSPGTLVVYVCTLTDAQQAPSASNACGSLPRSGAIIDARDSQGRGNVTRSNTTAGQYDIGLPLGTYTVRVSEGGAGTLGSQASVTVTAGQTTYVNIAPPAMYSVSGTITSSNTPCIEGSTVVLTDNTNGRSLLAPVASDGTWSATNVPNGTYEVGGGKPSCIDAANPGSVTVASANVTQSADADLARTLTASDMVVAGQIQLSSSNMSFDTMVVATSSGGKTVVAQVDTTKTGTDNNYTLNLTSGTTWSVKAVSDGYESSATTVSSASVATDLNVAAIQGVTKKEPKPYTVTPSRGGIVTNTDVGSDFELNVPSGALGSSTNSANITTQSTTVIPDTAVARPIDGTGVIITPKDAQGQPITTLSSSSSSLPTITIPYSEAEVTEASGTEAKLYIGAWSDDKQAWESMPTTCDTTANTCTATVSHFSTFATLTTSSTSSNSNSNSNGGGGSSGGSSDFIPPDAPDSIVYSTDGKSVNITWKDPIANDLDLVEILRNSGGATLLSNDPIAFVAKGTQKFTDTTVKLGETYKYALRPRDLKRNKRLSSEYTITIAAPKITDEVKKEEVKVTAPDEKKVVVITPVAAPKPVEKVVNTSTQNSSTRDMQVNKIKLEAGAVASMSRVNFLSFVKKMQDAKREGRAVDIMKKVLSGVLPKDAKVQEAFKNFVAYGTETTDLLGDGERAGVVNSFKAAFGELPISDADWEDVIKIGNGRWPTKRSVKAEDRAKRSFKSIYLREPDMKNTNDNAAITIMAYGLRSDKRNMASEKVAIKLYQKIFEKDPTTATAWDAVRAISYSGAKR